jgi:hypothetical protein
MKQDRSGSLEHGVTADAVYISGAFKGTCIQVNPDQVIPLTILKSVPRASDRAKGRPGPNLIAITSNVRGGNNVRVKLGNSLLRALGIFDRLAAGEKARLSILIDREQWLFAIREPQPGEHKGRKISNFSTKWGAAVEFTPESSAAVQLLMGDELRRLVEPQVQNGENGKPPVLTFSCAARKVLSLIDDQPEVPRDPCVEGQIPQQADDQPENAGDSSPDIIPIDGASG